MRNLLLVLLATVLADFSAAQVAKMTLPFWNVETIEKFYRVRSDTYHHDLKPNVDTIGSFGNRRYRMRTNSLGFKDGAVRDVSLETDRRRILFIGDSFTEGNGVEFDDTFVGIIGKELAPQGIEVLNAAVSGYSPHMYYRKVRNLLEEVGLKFDAVVAFVDLSDVPNEARDYQFDDYGNVITRQAYLPAVLHQEYDVTRGQWLELKLKNNSVLARTAYTLKHLYLDPEPPVGFGACREYKGNESILEDHDYSMWTLDEERFRRFEPGIRIASRNMDRLYSLLSAHGIPLTVVIYPWPDQILWRDIESRHVSIWREWTADHGVTFINLFPKFINDSEEAENTIEKYYIPCDMHWNESGHQQVARWLLEHYQALLPPLEA